MKSFPYCSIIKKAVIHIKLLLAMAYAMSDEPEELCKVIKQLAKEFNGIHAG